VDEHAEVVKIIAPSRASEIAKPTQQIEKVWPILGRSSVVGIFSLGTA
jgi:hypothetical protein